MTAVGFAVVLGQLGLAVGGDRLVAGILHGELPLALGHAAQRCAVAKHVAQGHLQARRMVGAGRKVP